MLPRIPNRYFPDDRDGGDRLSPLQRGPFEPDDSARLRRLTDDDDNDAPRWKWIFVAGCLMLGAFGILASLGWSGFGVVLVPAGLGMVIGGGIPLLLNRI